MRIALIIFSFVMVFTNVAMAVDCSDIDTADECTAIAGCGWGTTNGCTICQSGTYSSNTDQTCKSCGTPPQGTNWDSNTTGITEADQCKWTVSCDAGTYYDGTECVSCYGTGRYSNSSKTFTGFGTTAPTNNQCQYACGSNSKTTQNGTGCTCIAGYHTQNQSQNHTTNNSTNCVANSYTITYKSNNDSNSSTTQSATYQATVTLKDKNTFSNPGYELSGWKCTSGCSTTYNPEQQITYNYTDNITLDAQWTGKEFTITFQPGTLPDPDNNMTISNNINGKTCKYGDSNCTAPLATTYRCTTSTNTSQVQCSGYHFTGWKCTSGCTDSEITYAAGTNIANISNGNNMTLTAQWEKCPAGYYCTDVISKEKCPIGSTSAAGNASNQNCYIDNTTQFCDGANNCYSLPAGTKICYQSGTGC